MAKARLEGVLDCNNKPFIRSMNQAVAYSKTTGSRISTTFATMGASMAALRHPAAIAAAAVGFGTKAVFNYAGKVTDLSASVDLSTDKFQQFSFAIEQAGGKQEDLTKGMSAIIAKLQEARDGNETAIKDFEQLGITLEALKTIAPDEVLLRMADALKETGGSSESIANVMDILGSKVARSLVPALKDGRDAFLEVGKSARIMEADSIRAVEGLGDKLEKWKRSTMNTFGNNLGTAIQAATNWVNGTKGAQGPTGQEPVMMDEIEVKADPIKPRRRGFWQTDLPTMTKRTGMEEKFGPNIDGSIPFAGFGSGYFPGQSGGLRASGGLSTGGLSSSGLGGSGSAYGKVRAGDAQRAKDAAKGKDPLEAAAKATAANTAALAKAWGVEGVTAQ